MRLTLFSDYTLRTLLFLGVHHERLVPLGEIAEAYNVSHNHLVKVSGTLNRLGLVETVRGRGGGLRLAQDPEAINIGWLIRETEPDFHLVECFDRANNTCPITPACMLKHVLFEARDNFLETLDRYTLADFLASPKRRDAFVRLWSQAAAEVPGEETNGTPPEGDG